MSNLAQFIGAAEVGETRSFVGNPASGNWLMCNGADYARTAYPLLAALLPVGVFTATTRTLAATPGTVAIDTDGTNFLAPGATGTNALQATADGITWVTTTGAWTASTAFPSIIKAGARWVIAPSAGESQPYVIAIGGTAAALVVKANWTATTGAAITSLKRGLAYDSVAGKTVLCRNGSLATASALFYLADGATAWTAASGGSTMTRDCVVFSGQKVMAFGIGNIYQVSSDGGVTYTDAYLPFQLAAASDAVSDGAGTVVVLCRITSGNLTTANGGAGFLVTRDHGATWKFIDAWAFGELGGYASSERLSCVNGRFICAIRATPQCMVSTDGEVWVQEPIPLRGKGGFVTGESTVYAYKSGVYCALGEAATGLTATEDTAKFRVPADGAQQVTAVGMLYKPAGKLYIKAR